MKFTLFFNNFIDFIFISVNKNNMINFNIYLNNMINFILKIDNYSSNISIFILLFKLIAKQKLINHVSILEYNCFELKCK